MSKKTAANSVRTHNPPPRAAVESQHRSRSAAQPRAAENQRSRSAQPRAKTAFAGSQLSKQLCGVDHLQLEHPDNRYVYHADNEMQKTAARDYRGPLRRCPLCFKLYTRGGVTNSHFSKCHGDPPTLAALYGIHSPEVLDAIEQKAFFLSCCQSDQLLANSPISSATCDGLLDKILNAESDVFDDSQHTVPTESQRLAFKKTLQTFGVTVLEETSYLEYLANDYFVGEHPAALTDAYIKGQLNPKLYSFKQALWMGVEQGRRSRKNAYATGMSAQCERHALLPTDGTVFKFPTMEKGDEPMVQQNKLPQKQVTFAPSARVSESSKSEDSESGSEQLEPPTVGISEEILQEVEQEQKEEPPQQQRLTRSTASRGPAQTTNVPVVVQREQVAAGGRATLKQKRAAPVHSDLAELTVAEKVKTKRAKVNVVTPHRGPSLKKLSCTNTCEGLLLYGKWTSKEDAERVIGIVKQEKFALKNTKLSANYEDRNVHFKSKDSRMTALNQASMQLTNVPETFTCDAIVCIVLATLFNRPDIASFLKEYKGIGVLRIAERIVENIRQSVWKDFLSDADPQLEDRMFVGNVFAQKHIVYLIGCSNFFQLHICVMTAQQSLHITPNMLFDVDLEANAKNLQTFSCIMCSQLNKKLMNQTDAAEQCKKLVQQQASFLVLCCEDGQIKFP